MRLRRVGRTVLVAFIGLAILVVFLAWLVLESRYFKDVRADFIEQRISKLIGVPLNVEGDVRLSFRPQATLSLDDVAILGATDADPDFVRISHAELSVAPWSLLAGAMKIEHMILHETQLEALRYADGRPSWHTLPASETTPSQPPDLAGLLAFLLDRTVDFQAISIRTSNQVTGLDLDFLLETLQLEETDATGARTLHGAGSLNGSGFSVSGDFPSAGPVSLEAEFAGARLKVDGIAPNTDDGFDFSGTLALAVDGLADFLGVIGLTAPYDGTASLEMSLDKSGSVTSASEIVAQAKLDSGGIVTLEGSIGDLWGQGQVALELSGQVGADAMAKAEELPLAITGFLAKISSVEGGYRLDSVSVETAAVEGAVGNIGPVSVDRVRITEAELLELTGIRLQMGTDRTGTYIVEGRIGDALSLSDLTFDGHMSVPLAAILTEKTEPPALELGRIEGEFSMNDAQGSPQLTHLQVKTVDTDLWSVNLTGQVADLRDLDAPALSARIVIPDPIRLLSELQLDGSIAGPIELNSDIAETNGTVKTSHSLQAGRSDMTATLEGSVRGTAPVVRGSVESRRLDLRDLASLASLARELSTLAQTHGRNVSDEQPLIMPKSPSSLPPEVIDDPSIAWQPLIMGTPDPADTAAPDEPAGASGSPDEQPLVIGKVAPEDAFIERLLAPEGLRKLDLEVPINIRELTGQQAVSSVQSDLAIKNGAANVGPLNIALGGGSATVDIGINLLNAPEVLRVSGTTQGWDIAKILAAVGSDFPVIGKPSASFDLRARYVSPQAFLDSMAGTLSVRMGQGAIGTSFLDLAGLGVIPWLFSRELGQGYTDVVCISAPLSVANGRVSTRSTVLETRRVQIVLGGVVDWKRDRVSLRGEPRPVGQPLAVSPWPFEITGALSNPQFNLPKATVRRSQVPLEFGGTRIPCRPDIEQLRPVPPTGN